MSDWKNVQYKDGKMRTSEGGGGGGSSTFAGLDDVSFNNLQNGQVPKYNSTTQKWENANESGGGGTVTDVQVDGVSVVNPQGVAEIETPNAGGIEYDNQQSGLSATDVQGAIDELARGSGGGGVEDVEVNGTSVVNAQNVAEITSYKEVTLAEYQALPSTKLSDGVMYCIKDTGGADSFPPLIYSDEEREIGVWRDGKPLYQKTVHWTGSLNNGQYIIVDSNINLSNADSFVSDIAYFKFSGYPHIAGSITGKKLDVELLSQGVAIENFINYTILEIWVTYRYTKTTDTAGSGTWTTQGGYAHHYSTSEKVIGTWIDGKSLYERTAIFTNSSGISGEVNLMAIDSTWRLIDAKVHVYNSSNQRTYFFPYISSIYNSIIVSNGYLRLVSNDSWGSAYSPFYITIQYTKTTD